MNRLLIKYVNKVWNEKSRYWRHNLMTLLYQNTPQIVQIDFVYIMTRLSDMPLKLLLNYDSILLQQGSRSRAFRSRPV